MKLAFQPRLVNSLFGDPCLFVGLRWSGRAVLFDLGRLDRAIALAEGSLSGFPPPHEAQRLVEQTTHAQVERAWHSALRGRTLTAVLDG